MSLNNSIDQHIYKQIQDSKISVITTYNNHNNDNSNAAHQHQQQPEYTDLPLVLDRQSYLYKYNYIITEYYNINNINNIQYTLIDGTILPYNITIGLLYDIFYHNNILNIDIYNQIPWTLLITVDNNNNNNIYTQLYSTILHNIRQSLTLQYGQCIVNTVLDNNEINQLYDSIIEYDQPLYDEIIQKLILSHTTLHTANRYQFIPIRLYIVNIHNTNSHNNNKQLQQLDTQQQQQQTRSYIVQQRKISIYKHDSNTQNKQYNTLYDMLYNICPYIFDTATSYNNDTTIQQQSEQYLLYNNMYILCQGIELSLDIPLYWLYQHMHSIDQWLYIVVKKQNSD